MTTNSACLRIYLSPLSSGCPDAPAKQRNTRTRLHPPPSFDLEADMYASFSTLLHGLDEVPTDAKLAEFAKPSRQACASRSCLRRCKMRSGSRPATGLVCSLMLRCQRFRLAPPPIANCKSRSSPQQA